MAGVNPKLLANSLNRARNLINDSNFNRVVELNSKNRKINFDDTPYIMDNNVDNISTNERKNNISLSEDNFKASKLPKEILNEIQKNPLIIDNSASIIDELIEPVEIKKVPITNNIRENNTSGIDYTIIKAIVDESVKRNLNEIFNNMLSESKNNNYIQLLRIGKGNKIQVLDSKGNLYESILSLKKNINKKQ